MTHVENLRKLLGHTYSSTISKRNAIYRILRWLKNQNLLNKSIAEAYAKAEDKAEIDYYLDDADWDISIYNHLIKQKESEDFILEIAAVERLLNFYCCAKGIQEVYITHSVIDNIINHCLIEYEPVESQEKKSFWGEVADQFKNLQLGDFW